MPKLKFIRSRSEMGRFSGEEIDRDALAIPRMYDALLTQAKRILRYAETRERMHRSERGVSLSAHIGHTLGSEEDELQRAHQALRDLIAILEPEAISENDVFLDEIPEEMKQPIRPLPDMAAARRQNPPGGGQGSGGQG